MFGLGWFFSLTLYMTISRVLEYLLLPLRNRLFLFLFIPHWELLYLRVESADINRGALMKTQHFADGKIPISDDACICKRGEYLQFRMWLLKEGKKKK